MLTYIDPKKGHDAVARTGRKSYEPKPPTGIRS